MTAEQTAGPFIKCVGGKRGLLYRLGELAPRTIATFFEPFVGGGALFWHLAKEGRFKRAVLADANLDLVRTWIAIQRNYVGLLRELDKHKHNRKHYERVRALDSKKLSDEACGARFIYLNRAGYNGLWRVNASGKMNVPFGIQPKMTIFAGPTAIRACSRVLNDHKVTIVNVDFEDALRRVRLGDFVYFDPPYAPLSKTSSFTKYNAKGFDTSEQERLAKVFKALDDRGVAALLSNSSCDLIEQLYAGRQIERIMAKRAINSDATKRGEVKEILVKSWALQAGGA